MKICKKEIGKTFLIIPWFRGCNEIIAKNVVLEKVGRVYLTFSGIKYKILWDNEFMVKATQSHESDSSVRIYKIESDIQLDAELSNLSQWFSGLSSLQNKRKIERLTISQLKEMKIIFERSE